jgi:hypothetical protein
MSLGLMDDELEESLPEIEDGVEETYEFDIDEMEDYTTQPMNEGGFEDEVDEEVLPEFMEKLNESLDMFRRFKNYN